jgi:hypothetical protein
MKENVRFKKYIQQKTLMADVETHFDVKDGKCARGSSVSTVTRRLKFDPRQQHSLFSPPYPDQLSRLTPCSE